MTAVALLLLGAAVGHGVALALKIPAVPMLVAAGIVLRATGLVADFELLSSVLQLGVTLLVFTAGTELNPKRFAHQGRASVQVGLLQFTLLAAVGLGIALAWKLSVQQAAYIALAIAASSTFVVVRVLKAKRQFYEPFGRLVLGVLLVQDVLVILLLAALLRWDEGLLAVESGVLRTVLLLAVAFLSARSVVPWLLTRLKLDDEAILIVVLANLFLFVGAAYWLDVPLVTGAFCAGFAVSSFPVNGVIRGQLTSLSDFFIAMFFTALGASLVLPEAEQLWLALTMVVAVLVVTPPLVTWAAERSGMTSRSAIESGLLLAQTSEFSVVVALLGAERGHLDSGLLGAVALLTVITMILTQFIATDGNTWRLLRIHPSRFKLTPKTNSLRNHVVLLGCGSNTERLVLELVDREETVVVIDDDPAVDSWVERVGAIPIRGDASDPFALQQAGAPHARVVISTLRRHTDNCRVIAYLKDVQVLVRVFEDEDARMIEDAGGTAIRYSDAAAEAFLAWMDQRYQEPGGAIIPAHPEKAAGASAS